jgi:hypothetical protein
MRIPMMHLLHPFIALAIMCAHPFWVQAQWEPEAPGDEFFFRFVMPEIGERKVKLIRIYNYDSLYIADSISVAETMNRPGRTFVVRKGPIPIAELHFTPDSRLQKVLMDVDVLAAEQPYYMNRVYFKYDASGRLIAQTQWHHYAESAQRPAVLSDTLHRSYDGKGRLKRQYARSYSIPDVYTIPEYGLISNFIYKEGGSSFLIRHTYDGKQKWLRTMNLDSVALDAQGRIASMHRFFEAAGHFVETRYHLDRKYVWNPQGQLQSIAHFSYGDTIQNKDVFTYDQQGRLVEKKTFHSPNEQTGTSAASTVRTLRYGAHGLLEYVGYLFPTYWPDREKSIKYLYEFY